MECSVDECDQRATTKDLCGKHYMRQRRHGDVETVLRPSHGVRGPSKKPRPECSIEECHRPVLNRGWCSKHYQRWHKYGDPLFIKREVSQLGPEATFRANVDQRGPDECWPWKRPPMGTGYGQIQWLDGKVWNAHRVAYLLAYGEIPAGDPGDPIEIDHLCHDLNCTVRPCPHRLCCNPAHLEAKPRSANTARTEFWAPHPCPAGCTCRRHPGSGRLSA